MSRFPFYKTFETLCYALFAVSVKQARHSCKSNYLEAADCIRIYNDNIII